MDKNRPLSLCGFEKRAQRSMLRPSNFMKFSKFQRVIGKINLRAAGALLIFLLIWIAVPAAMLAEHSTEDFCSMECCMAEGHCCCAAAKPFVEGKDYSDIAKFNSPEIGSACPCPVTPPSNSKITPNQIARTLSRVLAVDEQPLPIHRAQDSFYRAPQLTPNSSRAPPIFPI